jgi:hypothetical protein
MLTNNKFFFHLNFKQIFFIKDPNVSRKLGRDVSQNELEIGYYLDTFSTICDMSLVFFDTLWFSRYRSSKFWSFSAQHPSISVREFFKMNFFQHVWYQFASTFSDYLRHLISFTIWNNFPVKIFIFLSKIFTLILLQNQFSAALKKGKFQTFLRHFTMKFKILFRPFATPF